MVLLENTLTDPKLYVRVGFALHTGDRSNWGSTHKPGQEPGNPTHPPTHQPTYQLKKKESLSINSSTHPPAHPPTHLSTLNGVSWGQATVE